jgi:hypothetical protein
VPSPSFALQIDETSDISCDDVTLPNSTIWPRWNSIYTASTSTATTVYAVADDTWPYWNTNYYRINLGSSTSSTTGASYQVWTAWNGSYRVYGCTPDARTSEEIETANRKATEVLERERARLQRIEEAEQRAKSLLRDSLSRDQLIEFETFNYFTVISRDGQRRYRIRKGWSHNVERIDERGERLHTLCAHPGETVPEHDNMLAQKLMLEHCEEDFLKIANKGEERRRAAA